MIGEQPGWIFPPEEDFPPYINQLRDFRNFLFTAFRQHGLGTPTLRQYELAYQLQHGGDKLLLQGFRGMGKSTETCIFVDWTLFWWPLHHAIMLSAAQEKAVANLKFCRELFETVDVLRPLAPGMGQTDSALAFDIAGSSPSLDTSVRAVGVMGQVTGYHGDLVIPDDIEIPNNSDTPSAREKLRGRTTEVSAISNPNAIRIFLGTPQNEDTTYIPLAARGYKVIKWPAEYPDRARLASYGDQLAPTIRAEVEADPTLVGRPTDPERYDAAVLEDKRLEYGASGYALQFLLDTTLTDSERFPLRLSDLVVMDVSTDLAPEHVVWASSPELIHTDIPCLGRDGDRFHRPMRLQGDWLPYTGSVLAVDPSGRGKDELAWFVVKLLNGQLFVPDFGAELDGFDAIPRVAEAAARHKVHLLRCEEWGGGSFTKLLKDALREVHPCQVEEITQKQRKERRIIRTLEPIMQRHKLVFDAEALRKDVTLARARGGETWIYYSLAHQITRIADQPDCLPHDDRIDALAMAVDAFATRVELSAERMIDERRQEEQRKRIREHMAGLRHLDPASLEPNPLRDSNRGLKILRGRGVPIRGGFRRGR